MQSNQNILCFICGQFFPSTEIQNHIFKDKLSYEGKKKVHLKLPEEYDLLFKTIKGGLSLTSEDLENFNNLIASKSLHGNSTKLNNTMNSPELQSTMSSYSKVSNLSKTTTQQRRKSPPRAPGQRPRMLICPLCGKEFGTMSLPIHMKTCRQRFEYEQAQLPKKLRRSADKIIAQYEMNNAMLSGGGGTYNLDAMNDQAFDNYNQNALVPCEYCGRTFLPDRLVVHLRSHKNK